MLFNKNDKAVSPIVATLVLIVVAIIGAALVGSILQAFGTNVQGQANSGDTAAGTSGEITIAGSTTAYPAESLLGQAFMDAHQGIKVTVGQGGSDAGIAGAEQQSIDIGSSSKDVDVQSPAPAGHPTLQKFRVGGRAVVVIENGITGATMISQEACYNLYDKAGTGTNAGKVAVTVTTGAITSGGVAAGATTTVYQRADGSGTEETFAKWIGNHNTVYLGDGAAGADVTLTGTTNDFNTAKNLDASTAVGETGNEGVLQNVQNTANSIGFVDYGYVNTAAKLGANVKILNICDDTGALKFTADSTNMLAALKGDGTKYPIDKATADKYSPTKAGLVGPIEFLTHGTPTNIEKSFIDFAMNPDSKQYFNNVGLWHTTEF